MNPLHLKLYINAGYIVAAVLFILGLKLLSKPKTARTGNLLSALGMFVAVAVTLLSQEIVDWRTIIICVAIGSVIGVLASRLVALTAMPQMVAVFNGLGGGASLLVAWVALFGSTHRFVAIAVVLSIVIGGVTFAGSGIAWGKLSAVLTSKPVLFLSQRFVNAALFLVLIGCAVLFVLDPAPTSYFLYAIIGVALILGILTVLPIGGADMPVVISLLNSYSGLAACAAGLAINNVILIVSGALVGAAGIILTNIMCKAMNRSLANVLFSGFGAQKTATKVVGQANPITPEDAYLILEAANSVTFVPGYGMAVAQAQHVVHELGTLLENRGADVTYAIHPVAGRMPGHMNVLLAEANVPYDQLLEMDDINPKMNTIDVAVVIGANDVVNPAAREDDGSPIYGMPIINVDAAKTVFVLKRSLASGFSGVDNPLFFNANTRMLFGDAKQSISALITEFKD